MTINKLKRKDGRLFNQLRPLHITPHVLPQAEGSAEITIGNTRVMCSASVEPNVPKWLHTPGMGWVTAEYGMLPRSTNRRIRRDRALSGGRTREISRFIGRSLRSSIDLKKLGERQIHIDCDVITADGGTRTAAVTGGFVALALATQHLVKEVEIRTLPLLRYVSALSMGIYQNNILLDLCHEEDQQAKTDMNLVCSSEGEWIEIQGTAEKQPFTQQQLDQMLKIAQPSFKNLFKKQEQIIQSFFPLKKLLKKPSTRKTKK